MFTLFSADFIGNPGNCSYPHKTVVMDTDSMKAAVGHDYVCAEYKNHYRNSDNFLSADCLPVDCDNDHSEDPKDWITPADVLEAFPGVSLAIHYSRFNQREKNGKSARPKFHVLFPIDRVTDAALYSDMKKLVNSIFPYFDTKALDAARFFFGTQEPNVELYPGRMNLTEFLNDDEFDADLPGGHEKDVVIPEGSRNATMSRFAGIVIKKYGDTEKAYQSFLEKAATCVPPLDNSELNTIWHSAQRFYSKISREDGYVPPEVYNDENSYKPEDFSDVGQAEVLSKYFANELRYSPATHFIRYSDHYWQETEPGAQAVAHELTRRQLTEANRNMMEALQKLKNCGAQEILDNTSKAKAEQLMSDEQMEAYQEFLAAKAYQSFAVRRRDSKNITSTLKETHPMLEISPRDLDADCFLLCTPEATYDLRKGMAGAREHSADDFITKITSVSPGSKGAQLWQDNLDLIFQKDQQLIDYVQMICGLAAIGKVFVEALIIAYGDGRNGKSTFWNAISRVLGGEVLMTVKEYLHQAYRLDQRIKSDTMEAQNLREMAGSVSAIQYDKDRVQTSRNTEAPFVRTLEKLWTLEKKIAGELEMLSDLKKQIREVIEAVPDTDERMVLKYRYIHNYTWEQIGMELCADARTIRRWHGKALLHVTLPDDPIII